MLRCSKTLRATSVRGFQHWRTMASRPGKTAAPAGYTLYSIVAHTDNRENQTSHSMHVNKIKADLALLGVEYTETKLTFADIRGALARESGNDTVTVPTLRTPEGAYITDSFRIAEYLDARHGDHKGSGTERAPSLFPTPDAHAFARFINAWADGPLALAMRELFRPLFGTLNDPDSYEYFVRVRYAGAADELAAQLAALRDPEAIKDLAGKGRAALAPMEALLAADAAAGAVCGGGGSDDAVKGAALGSASGRFLLGTRPSHADAALFGWYLCSQVNARVMNPLVWRHSSLPHVGAWTHAMEDVTGLQVRFPDPEGCAV